ncbi:MAG: PTS sugar transporter subunit IIA [Gemmatimonadota bacterium]
MTPRCGVVVAHGHLAEGFVSALAHMAGPQSTVWGVSNEGLDGDALAAVISAGLATRGAGCEAILFSDLDGGSCGQVCRRLLAEGTVRAVFFGINLPLLIEFVFLQDAPYDTLEAALLAKSRQALGVHR